MIVFLIAFVYVSVRLSTTPRPMLKHLWLKGSEKRGIATHVRPSVCNVDESWPYRLSCLESN